MHASLAPPVTQRPLRRLAFKLVALVAAKFALLALIWWVASAPYPHADTRPAAVERHLAPTPSASHGDPP